MDRMVPMEAMLHHRETATQDEDLNGFQVREMEDHLMATTVQDSHLEMAIQGEDRKEIQTHMVGDHLMAMIAQDDQMEMEHHSEDRLLMERRLEDHLLEDRQDLGFQIQVHQVHQESLQVQQMTEDVNTNQTDVFEM